jgi:hypothetical protein
VAIFKWGVADLADFWEEQEERMGVAGSNLHQIPQFFFA